jgi:hypothetical protein
LPNDDFEAEKEILRHFSELARNKVIQILSVIGIYFVYFQIVLDNDIRTANPSLFDNVSFDWPFRISLGCSAMNIAFGFLTCVLVWFILGLFWYARVERIFYDPGLERMPIPEDRRPLAIVYTNVVEIATKTNWGFLRFMGGLRVFTELGNSWSWRNLFRVLGVLVFYLCVMVVSVWLIARIKFS